MDSMTPALTRSPTFSPDRSTRTPPANYPSPSLSRQRSFNTAYPFTVGAACPMALHRLDPSESHVETPPPLRASVQYVSGWPPAPFVTGSASSAPPSELSSQYDDFAAHYGSPHGIYGHIYNGHASSYGPGPGRLGRYGQPGRGHGIKHREHHRSEHDLIHPSNATVGSTHGAQPVDHETRQRTHVDNTSPTAMSWASTETPQRTYDLVSAEDLLAGAAGRSHRQTRQGKGPAPRKNQRRMTTREEANFQCEVKGCGKLFSRSYNYKAHMETHDEKREYPFPCQVENCDKKFVRKTDLQRHHQSVHAKEKNHGCDYCGRLFSRKDTLRRHMDDGCSRRFDLDTLGLQSDTCNDQTKSRREVSGSIRDDVSSARMLTPPASIVLLPMVPTSSISTSSTFTTARGDQERRGPR